MFEIDGTAYKNKEVYRQCLEKMKTRSKRNVKMILELRAKASDQEELKLLEEAYFQELHHLAYSHFNLAWLKYPEIMKHYAADLTESEGTDNDTI